MDHLVGVGYAVVDTETTGFAARGRDRIVEVAVVHLDETGTITNEWCTLINPARDLGPQHIHHITAAEIWHAPTFAEISGALAAQLRNRVLVAHNLSFDARFLSAEFGRLGIDWPTTGLCTMRLSDQYLPHRTGRSLQACCDAAGIPPHNAHSALHDAQAAAHLFTTYLRTAGHPTPWQHLINSATNDPWPTSAAPTALPVRRGQPATLPPITTTTIPLTRGDTVVFTGQMSSPRDVWIDRASAAGLRVIQGYVTKATRVLVAADPFTLSSKARRARAYEIPIVTEQAFDSMLTRLT
ncbi:exonuclease domain-containing protein [Umezawaea endophytica]|uniref:Exonuclease domain-containing protein n=1 Tax=Umezawaea endophytica TaxID=1654476 RepID=A0A9X2VVW5_9PSEU|nr:exonuclease domain-containing protein [Umezawaea endophytica]MCS7483650.1 exonuclease domain-containing protein [Umezawaea endophytica]